MKLALIAIVLIDITIAFVWFRRSSHPSIQAVVRPATIVLFRPEPVYVPAGATSQVCQLHGRIRTNGVVRVYYGTPAWSAETEAFDNAKSALFPNAWRSLHGGCVVRYSGGQMLNATQALVSICPGCLEAERRWKKKHGKTPA